LRSTFVYALMGVGVITAVFVVFGLFVRGVPDFRFGDDYDFLWDDGSEGLSS
jgi:hypothetical protein